MGIITIIQNLSKGFGRSGGGSPPIDPLNPNDSPSVINWYDVTDNSAITLSGGRVIELLDKKSSRDITETYVGQNFPSYSANGGSNDKAFITIDPTQSIRDTLGTWAGSNGATAFLVMRMQSIVPHLNGNGNYQNVILSYFNNQAGLITDNLAGGYGPYLYAATGGVYYNIFDTFVNTDWVIVCMKTIVGERTQLFPNNQPCGITCKTDIDGMGPFHINLGYFSLNAAYEMSELLFADETLTDEDQKGIMQYLIDKYEMVPKLFLHCHGDSLTAGSCDPASNWPFMVASDNNMQLVNFGVGGTIVEPNNGSTGVANFNFIDLLPNSLKWPYAGQWTVVGYGVNDTNQGGVDATWKTLYTARLQEMLSWGFNPNKFILTIPPSTSIRQSFMAATNAYIGQIASELGLILFDANALFLANGGDSLFADTLHPNAAGNILTASAITSIINS